jgi:hypothetical protein
VLAVDWAEDVYGPYHGIGLVIWRDAERTDEQGFSEKRADE